jgi:hypothetical protein
MLKSIPYLLLMLILIPSSAFASVNVQISNNLEGSSNNVNVKSNTSGNIQNQTDIVINNNGEKKEYHGSGGNIELKSDDGKSSVTVNTTGASNNAKSSSSTVNSHTNITVNSDTDNSLASASAQATIAGIFKEEKQEHSGFWEYLKKELDSIFKIFGLHS